MSVTINGTNGVTYNNSTTDAVAGLGTGNQTWQDVKASRSTGTTYTNSTGRPIMVCISTTGGANGDLVINGVYIGRCDSSGYQTVSGVVPNSGTYSLNGGIGIIYWAELR
jgi:glyoxylate carboligase